MFFWNLKKKQHKIRILEHCLVECRICNQGGCRFESRPRLLRTKPSMPPGSVNEYQLRLGRQRQVYVAHSDCGWTCGCAGKTVKSLENTCHTWALLRWWVTTKRRYIKCMAVLWPYCTTISAFLHKSTEYIT